MIRFDSVSKTYTRGAKPALDDVSVEIERGDFVFLVGSSGSGKSTFLKLILREERPTQGDIYVAEGVKTAWFKDPDGNILSLFEGDTN